MVVGGSGYVPEECKAGRLNLFCCRCLLPLSLLLLLAGQLLPATLLQHGALLSGTWAGHAGVTRQGHDPQRAAGLTSISHVPTGAPAVVQASQQAPAVVSKPPEVVMATPSVAPELARTSQQAGGSTPLQTTDILRKVRCYRDRRMIWPRCSKPGVAMMKDTACPGEAWVDAIVQSDPSPDKVIVNVGCNKGNDAINWLQRFDRRGFWDSKKWIDEMKNVFEEKIIFRCTAKSKFATPPRVDGVHGFPTCVCVEAVPSTFRSLVKLSHMLGYDDKAAPGRLQLVHAAAVDSALPNQTLLFSDAPAGHETSGVFIDLDRFPKVPVPAKTVDSLCEELALGKVDILLVDTEGSDPMVLDGAAKTLDSARYVEFEVHRDLKGTPWGNISLYSVIQKLNNRGFDCYWAGRNDKLLSLTNCWEDRFERGTWANAVCVKRGDVWWGVMEQFCPGSNLTEPPQLHASVQVGSHLVQLEGSHAAGVEGFQVCDGDNLVVRPRCSLLSFVPGRHSCPEHGWVDDLVKRDANPEKVIVNIGCDSGNDAIAWLQRFDPHGFWNSETWANQIGHGSRCPSLRAYSASPLQTQTAGGSRPTAVCVEADESKVKHMEDALAALGYHPNSSPPGIFHIVHASALGTTASDHPTTPAKTADAIVEDLGLSKVDVLKITVQGAESAVLLGALTVLTSVRYLEFEVNRALRGTHWGNTTLHSVITLLDDKDFDCYWALKERKLVSLTHCFDYDKHETGSGGTVVCAKRRDVWWKVLESFCPGAELATKSGGAL
eukprot:gb/GFBE01068223.1/.p1 GENE.gb/GFBE01068223.1/~~gb/GFBE01068223.1/.p1  ORF type:complete len:775 (+),score=67.26 gb/GFBE01068223.1/:1-2325(+)